MSCGAESLADAIGPFGNPNQIPRGRGDSHTKELRVMLRAGRGDDAQWIARAITPSGSP